MSRTFRLFCGYWQLNTTQGKLFWDALAGSDAPHPQRWRHQLILYEQTGLGSPTHLTETVSPPAVVIAVLEALIIEQRLPATVAREIEERILERTGRDGRWIRFPSH
jgi:hypothetical protein